MRHICLKDLYCHGCNVTILRYLDNLTSISPLNLMTRHLNLLFLLRIFFSRCFSKTKYLKRCIYTTVNLLLVYSIRWMIQNWSAWNNQAFYGTSYIIFPQQPDPIYEKLWGFLEQEWQISFVQYMYI